MRIPVRNIGRVRNDEIESLLRKPVEPISLHDTHVMYIEILRIRASNRQRIPRGVYRENAGQRTMSRNCQRDGSAAGSKVKHVDGSIHWKAPKGQIHQ